MWRRTITRKPIGAGLSALGAHVGSIADALAASVLIDEEEDRLRRVGLDMERRGRAEERALNYRSLLRFGRQAFPDWVRKASSPYHRYVDAVGRRMAANPEPQTRFDMAPRASAKSTWVSKIFSVWVICHQEEIAAERGEPLDFILLCSNALALPISFVRDIRTELEQNVYLRDVYPDASGRGTVKWTEEQLLTRNGVWLAVGSTNKSLRGTLKGKSRPNCCLCDDLENKENASTADQRRKTLEWFEDVLTPMLAPNPIIWVQGTPLHVESLMETGHAKHGGRRFKSIIRESSRNDLWDRWRDIYLDVDGELGDSREAAARLFESAWPLLESRADDDDHEAAADDLFERWHDVFKIAVGMPGDFRLLRYGLVEALDFAANYSHVLPGSLDDVREEWESCVLEPVRDVVGRRRGARAFFDRHRDDMLADTRVLWEQQEDYYRLQQIKADTSARSFNQEKQCQPRTREEQLFTDDMWSFWTAPSHPTPQQMRAAFPDGTIFVAALDPSLGKKSKRHDFASIAIVGGMPGKWARVAWSWIRREKPSRIIEKVFALHEAFEPKWWVIEVNQFQELLADLVLERGMEEEHFALPVEKVVSTVDKHLRIVSLEPVIANGQLQYPARTTDAGARVPLFPDLWGQFLGYGEADVHDDGPDSVEMAWAKWREVAREHRRVPYLMARGDHTDAFLGDDEREERRKQEYLRRMIRTAR